MSTTPRLPLRPGREPMFNLPGVVLALVGLLVGIHALLGFVSDETAFRTLIAYGFVPGVWTFHFSPDSVERLLETALAGDIAGRSERLAIAHFILSQAQASPWTFLTYAGLHGSWPHVLLNSLWLVAFGTPVARRCGTVRLLVLAAVTAIAGALAHWASHPYDLVPMVGASATVSGMMAAAARFMFTPTAPGGPALPPDARAREGLADLLRNRRALIFFAVWFGINLVFGLGAVPLGLSQGGIAWEAHMGGFVAGLFLFPFLDVRPRRPA